MSCPSDKEGSKVAQEYFCAYHSYIDFMQELGDAECGRLFKACLEYSRTGTAPELRGNERFVFAGIKSQIDRDKEKYLNRCKQNSENRRTTNANDRQRSSTGVNESHQGKGEGKVKGDWCYPPNPLADVMTAYMEKVNPTPSQTSMEELKGYVEQMGGAVCLRAIDVALDAGKGNWNYIRAILRDKLSKGVKCLADWDAMERAREKEAEQSGGIEQRTTPAE